MNCSATAARPPRDHHASRRVTATVTATRPPLDLAIAAVPVEAYTELVSDVLTLLVLPALTACDPLPGGFEPVLPPQADADADAGETKRAAGAAQSGGAWWAA